MVVYLDLVILLNVLVDTCLILGTNRLSGYPPGWLRSCLAGILGGCYAGMCVLPGFGFLAGIFWRLVFLWLMALCAFGLGKGTLRRGVLLVFLSFCLSGIGILGSGTGFWSLLGEAGLLLGLCFLGFGSHVGQKFIPVEIRLGDRQVRVNALHDTGNNLRDPVSGEGVLVLGAGAAWDLMGLSGQELRDPVQTLLTRGGSGLRLIPYAAVGKDKGMLLAARCGHVRIGGRTRSAIVAFAPQELGKEYQALIGGMS